MTKRLLGWIFLGILSPGLHASEDISTAASFAFPSIQQGASARAIALGSTYVGIAEGSASLLWNPADLADLSFQGRDTNGAITSAYTVRIYGANLGWGVKIPPGFSLDLAEFSLNLAGFSLSLALEINHQDLSGTAAEAFAEDLRVLWNRSPNFRRFKKLSDEPINYEDLSSC